MTGTRITPVATAATVLVLALMVAGSVHAQQPGFQAATYTDRLRIPFRNDRLGISRSVTTDPVTAEILVTDWRYGRIVIFDEELIYRFMFAGDRFITSPNEVAVDPDGFLVVLPSSGRSLSYLDFDGAYLGNLSLMDLPADLLGEPRLVSVALSPDGQTVYTLDENNKRLWIMARDGRIRNSVDLGSGRDDREFQDLLFGHVDVYDQTVLVALPTDGKILLFDLEGNPTGAVGRQGTATCQSGFPIAGALDAGGKVLLLDNQRALVSLWEVESNRCLGEFAGFGGGPGGLYRPLDMTLDARGRVFISQGFEGRVQVYQHDSPAAGTAMRKPDATADEAPAQASSPEN